MTEHVADVDAPGRGDRDRQDLQPEHPVEPQQPCQPLAAAEEERRLLAAGGYHRHQRHVLVEREPDETLAAAEVDLARVPCRAVDLVVAARVDEQRRARAERLVGVLRVGSDGAVLAQEAEAGHRQHQVVRELVEAALDPEVGGEREREHAGVGREVAARVVAHEEHRARGGDPVEVAHLGAEPDAREQPQAGQRLADVVGVALVEIGARHARLGLASHRARRPADQAREIGWAEAPPALGVAVGVAVRRRTVARRLGLTPLGATSSAHCSQGSLARSGAQVRLSASSSPAGASAGWPYARRRSSCG